MSIHHDSATGQGEALYWDASYAVARRLMLAHAHVDLESVSLLQICDWVLALPEFADDPDLANDELLAAIYQEWYEEIIPYDE